MACSLAGCKGKKTIIAVHVIPVERCLPLDAEVDAALGHAEGVMSAVEKQVEKLGHVALTDILQAREVGPAIVQACREHRADLILISLNSRVQGGEFRLGNLVHHILKNAPCRVILNCQADSELA
jgi:nucleotide-binding universal stress UspA family protein